MKKKQSNTLRFFFHIQGTPTSVLLRPWINEIASLVISHVPTTFLSSLYAYFLLLLSRGLTTTKTFTNGQTVHNNQPRLYYKNQRKIFAWICLDVMMSRRRQRIRRESIIRIV